ncbi:hypothetical protein RJT34_17506 [Clitoria ternatea]|uniref:3'-5' exonuclease domain-containing protein n=1 Tax=Clitoria ternatea TaxID=43366 RepID=A0AAN9PEX2_CLITE
MVDENGVPVWMRNRTLSLNPTHMISVVDHNLPYDTHNIYDITFHSYNIRTLLTSEPSFVDSWISDIRCRNRRNLLVGLDIEWRPNTQRNMQNPVATLQLCVGPSCLVFQILHAPFISQSLASFLSDPNHTFFGVGIEEDVEKLLEDYSLRVSNAVDLRPLAAQKLGDWDLNRAGIKTLGLRVLGLAFEKPQRITRSNWANPWLNAEQVQYATVDAFVSFEVGRCLISS